MADASKNLVTVSSSGRATRKPRIINSVISFALEAPAGLPWANGTICCMNGTNCSIKFDAGPFLGRLVWRDRGIRFDVDAEATQTVLLDQCDRSVELLLLLPVGLLDLLCGLDRLLILRHGPLIACMAGFGGGGGAPNLSQA